MKSPCAPTNLSTLDDSGIVLDSTAATFNSSSTSRMQHVTPSNDNMSSDEDRILDDKGYNLLDTYSDIHKDTERKLLDCDNDDIDLVGIQKAKPNHRMRKNTQPDDVERPKSKLLKKTLELARKKTDKASNFGKKSKLLKFKNLAKSVLMKEAQGEATYSSSLKSDDTDSSLDDNDNSVLSNDDTIAPKRFAKKKRKMMKPPKLKCRNINFAIKR